MKKRVEITGRVAKRLGLISKTLKKPKSVAKLKKELDKHFSLYIRLKSSKSGICTCYTCGRQNSINKMHCGHFISRSYLITRWDENNTKTQCPGCNLFGNGKPLDFEENLKRELGEEVVEKMKQSRHQIFKLTPDWLEERISYYKLQVEILSQKQ